MRMRTILLSLLIASLFLIGESLCNEVFAQFRANEPSANRNTGSILKVEQRQPTGNLSNFFNMKMYHSYEASFMSMGGTAANVNMYTNTMMFSFSPKLTGRLDLALAHSPFGNAMPGMNNQRGGQFIIRNAELNYQLSENTFIRFSYQEQPFSPFGLMNSGFNGFGGNGMINRWDR